MRLIAFGLLMALTVTLPAFAQKVITVGVVTDGPFLGSKRAVTMIKKEVDILTKGEFVVRFPKNKQHHGAWSKSGIENALQKLYKDPDVDIVIALGFSTAALTVTRSSYPQAYLGFNNHPYQCLRCTTKG